MFCVVDLETTSGNVSNAEILSGTFLAIDSTFLVLDEYQIKCRPRKWTEEAIESTKIHGITQQMTMGLPLFSEVQDDLFKWFKKFMFKHFVCHAKRDMYGKKTTFDHAVIRLNLFPSAQYWDFVNMFNERNIISTHSLASYLDKKYNFEKKDLKTVARQLGVTLENHHDDREDAIACYEIFKIMFPQVNLTEFINWDYYKIEVLNEDASRASKRNPKKPRGIKAFA
jgi:DNA polymerase III epsilon subunit-like protein